MLVHTRLGQLWLRRTNLLIKRLMGWGWEGSSSPHVEVLLGKILKAKFTLKNAAGEEQKGAVCLHVKG